jgi:hypothetical protein
VENAGTPFIRDTSDGHRAYTFESRDIVLEVATYRDENRLRNGLSITPAHFRSSKQQLDGCEYPRESLKPKLPVLMVRKATTNAIHQVLRTNMSRPRFSWLHLTDLHLGQSGQAPLIHNVRSRFFDDLANLHACTGPWNVVLFTGDLVQRGDKREFARLETEFLDPLWARMKELGSEPGLLAVPGNHDLERPKKLSNPSAALRLLLQKEGFHQIADEFYANSKGEYRKVVTKAFSNYMSWWTTTHFRRPGVRDGLLPGEFSLSLESDRFRVGVVGLNTTFLQLAGGNYIGRLVLDVRQFNAACTGRIDGDGAEWVAKHDICLLMTHQGFDWLDQPSQTDAYPEINPAGRFAVHLFGHMHENIVRGSIIGGGKPIYHWQGNSLFAMEPIGDIPRLERRHGYSAGTISFDLNEGKAELRHWPRKAINKGPNGWLIDRDGDSCVLDKAKDDGGTEVILIPLSQRHQKTAPDLQAAVLQGVGLGAKSREQMSPFDRSGALTGTPSLEEGHWLVAAKSSFLWKDADALWPELTAQFRDRVVDLVQASQEQINLARTVLGHDPWWDEGYPLRLLSRIEFIATDPRKHLNYSDASKQALHFSAAEAALLIAAPFVQVGIRASGLRAAMNANALQVESTGAATGVRGSLEKFYLSSARLINRAQRIEREKPNDAKAIFTWLLRRWLLREPEVWIPPPQGYLAPDYWRHLSTRATEQAVDGALEPMRLLGLTRCITAGLRRLEDSDQHNALRTKVTAAGGTIKEQTIRERLIANILALGGRMAIDVGTLSDVLIEHVGVRDPIVPAKVVEQIARAEWQEVRRHRVLHLICDHPALDLAAREHVRSAEDLLRSIQIRIPELVGEDQSWTWMPTRLTDDHVAPLERNGRPVYTTPPLQFRVRQKEIRELLMGEKLYGDSSFAIRELYQNALDACRYREARMLYVQRQGRPTQPWNGRIVFRQGKDRKGRSYIECSDNGIGMGHTELRDCFAVAGQRFADTTDFLEEQANWLRCRPPIRIYPNSQFGIGVFSYFMLSEEIYVQTRRFERDGNLGEVLGVTISSSGSLFRIRPIARETDAGTRVRLFLNSDVERVKPISCVDVLNELLWVADFETIAIHGHRRASWKPGGLRLPEELGKGSRVAQPTPDPALWWLSGQHGRILADGIATDASADFAVINLRHQYRPELSVNRKSIQKHDQEYHRRLLLNNVGYLAECTPEWLDFTWMWMFASVFPDLSDKLVAAFAARGAKLPVSHRERESKDWRARLVSVAATGCLPQDRDALECMQKGRAMTDSLPLPLLGVRCSVWRTALQNEVGVDCRQQEPFTTQSPTADEWAKGMAAALSTNLNGTAPWVDGPITVRHLVLASITFDQAPKELYRRLVKFTNILNLELPDKQAGLLPEESPEPLDIMLIRVNRSVTPRGRSSYIRGNLSIWHLLRLAARVRRPLATVFERLLHFSRLLQLELPTLDPASFPSEAVEPVDLAVLTCDFSGNAPLLLGDVQIGQIIGAAAKLNLSANDVIMRLRRFAPLLGYVVPDNLHETFANLRPESVDGILLSRRLDGIAPWLEGQVSIGHVLRAASRVKRKTEVVLRRIKRYSALLGLTLPEISLTALPSDPPSREDTILISLGLDGQSPWLSGKISPGHIIGAAVALKQEPRTILGRLQEYARLLGLHLGSVNPALLPTDVHEASDAILLSENLNGRHPWVHGNISQQHILRAAVTLQQTTERIFGRLSCYQPLLELQLPSLDQSAMSISPAETDRVLLSRKLDGKGKWARKIDYEHVVTASLELNTSAQQVVDRLNRLAPLHSLEISASALIYWPKEPPGRALRTLFSRDYDQHAPWVKEISPVRMVAASLKLEMPIAELYQLIQPYSLMCNEQLRTLGQRKLPTTPPHQIDKRVLARHATSDDLWRSETVPVGHITHVARSIHQPVAVVLDRLAIYRDILSIEIPTATLDMLPKEIPQELDCVLFSSRLNGSYPWLTARPTELHLRTASFITGRAEVELRGRVSVYEYLWVSDAGDRTVAHDSI